MAHDREEDDPLASFFNLKRYQYPTDELAPHKPFLVLVAFGALLRGKRWNAFEEVEPVLADLISTYGPGVAKPTPWNPWFHLQQDGVWRLDREVAPSSSGSTTRTAVLGTSGAFTERVLHRLERDESAMPRIVEHLLDTTVTPVDQDAVRAICGLPMGP